MRYSGTATQLTRVVFVNEQEGWITDGRLVSDKTQHYRPLLMRTTDQGKYWADVSADLNAHDASGYLNNIYAGEPSNAVLVDSDDRFFSTATGGQNWETVGKLTKLEPQIGIRQLGVRAGGRLWGLGSTGGREGTWTVLAVQEGDNSWTVYKSYKVWLRDAAFLSDTEVIACGSFLTNDKLSFDGGTGDGVILHSTNAGRNWSVVYRNPRVKTINALAVTGPDNVLAVGDGGLIVRRKTNP